MRVIQTNTISPDMDLVNELKKNPFLLAPMAGITDRAFRSFMREMGCGAVITELVSANGLKYSSEKTKRIMQFDECQHPVGIQIFGEDLESLGEAAKVCEDMGADFVDLNFGCPVPKVVKKGAGSAVLKDLVRLRDVLRATKSAVSIPVTIKVRTGWDEHSKNSPEVAQVAYDEGITWMAIHGRTRSQGYSGLAKWDYIQEVKKTSKIPIIGNGDIVSADLAMSRLSESGCDAVMIGRGCLKNPWIFQQSMQLYNGQKSLEESPIRKDFSQLFGRLRYHLEEHCDERLSQLQLRKFSAWFSSGYPGSAQFRRQVFQTKDRGDMISLIEDYFASIDHYIQEDTSHEPFLMGGHG